VYLTSSIKEATSMNKAQLTEALRPYTVYPPLSKFTKDELVSAWLERYGVKELDEVEHCQTCGVELEDEDVVYDGYCSSCG
jgi:hypothetical protein